MFAGFLLERFRESHQKDALIWKDKVYSYADLSRLVDERLQWLEKEQIKKGTIVSLEGEFSPASISTLIALVVRGCIVAPLTPKTVRVNPDFRDIAEVEMVAAVDEKEKIALSRIERKVTQPLLVKLRGDGHPGIIVFSSGSTGKSKAIVHDLIPFLDWISVKRKSMRMVSFLSFDHLGGINTLLAALSNSGCLILLEDRSPDSVLTMVEKYRVELLPISPTFLNLMLISNAYERHDLRSLKVITYGSEPMPELTLKRIHSIFPNVTLQQTYGTSEIGPLRSKSKAPDSLWVKLGGEAFETRVVGGLLEIKAKTAMLGYLNAPSPFTEDGWFKTGDAVEVDGEYFRILGRKSDLINIGGEKVYPSEIESVLMSMPGVEDVVVQGESNPLTGSIVKARFKLREKEELSEFRRRLWEFCRGKLDEYKVPQKIVISETALHTDRYKKSRAS